MQGRSKHVFTFSATAPYHKTIGLPYQASSLKELREILNNNPRNTSNNDVVLQLPEKKKKLSVNLFTFHASNTPKGSESKSTSNVLHLQFRLVL